MQQWTLYLKHLGWGVQYKRYDSVLRSRLIRFTTELLPNFIASMLKHLSKAKSPFYFRYFTSVKKLKVLCWLPFIFIPLIGVAQQTDTIKAKKDSSALTLTDSLKLLKQAVSKPRADTSKAKSLITQRTTATGQVLDDVTGKPLVGLSVSFTGSIHGIITDSLGYFRLSAAGAFRNISFSAVGYQAITKNIQPGVANVVNVRLKKSLTRLKEVVVRASKKKPYRNKGNPAVELIQQVIDHKPINRARSADYLQYDQYERTGFSLVNPPDLLTKRGFFNKFKFMLDSTVDVDGKTQTSLPVYFSEKRYKHYYRKDPEKTITLLEAEKETNIIKFVDTAGVDVYLRRFYGNDIDLYNNNIFILTNQFLSPIADHAPDFYKFFITDTIQAEGTKLIEVSFTPRAKGDLLFEGNLLVTLDGRYAVEAATLNVNRDINLNFLKDFKVGLNFTKYPDGRYYLKQSDVKADFGILGKKTLNVYGDRSVFYENYVLDKPQPEEFYKGKSEQTAPKANQFDNQYWADHRVDTLSKAQSRVYAKMNRLQTMKLFKVLTWVGATLTGDYANTGPVQIGPVGALYSFDKLEGSRFQLGGRTTPKFNKTIQLEGYGAFGTRDQVAKYDLATYISLNKTPFYRYANNYFKVSYSNDIGIPGQNFAINNSSTAFSSFQTSQSNYFLYNQIFKLEYVRDLDNHVSFNFGLKNWDQRAAGALIYQLNDAPDVVRNVTTSELDFGFRYAPHEQFIQGTTFRHTIYSKYPIFNVQVNHGIKGLINGSFNYTIVGARVDKRFYMSQLGFGDASLQGNYLVGKVPFPLLNIAAANQSIGYDPESYNQMRYLEFVSDHYASFNYTQSFNGFFLNKIPLIDHLKWREFLSFKALYGGLRNQNNPQYSGGLYKFPVAESGQSGTYGLGNVPYMEAGFGIGNIFKVLRLDAIRRFNYLDHPNVKQYGIKISLGIDL